MALAPRAERAASRPHRLGRRVERSDCAALPFEGDQTIEPLSTFSVACRAREQANTCEQLDSGLIAFSAASWANTQAPRGTTSWSTALRLGEGQVFIGPPHPTGRDHCGIT